MNKAIIIGNLGADPESIANGKGCRFSVATNEKWTDKSGNKQEHTEWHRIVCWGSLAENCLKYLSKGRQAAVEGSIRTSDYTDKEGVDRKSREIKAYSVEFLSGGEGSGGGDGRQRKTKPAAQDDGWGDDDGWDDSFNDDDIPF